MPSRHIISFVPSSFHLLASTCPLSFLLRIPFYSAGVSRQFRPSLNALIHCTHTPKHASTFTRTKGDMTRLDTHNQPAVIEAFKAWARTLTRAYAQFAVGFSRFSRAWLHRDTEERYYMLQSFCTSNKCIAHTHVRNIFNSRIACNNLTIQIIPITMTFIRRILEFSMKLPAVINILGFSIFYLTVPSFRRIQALVYVICVNALRLTINYLGQLSVSRRKVQFAGFTLRVTVPLTNLHRDLDFAGALLFPFLSPFFASS